MYTTIEPRLIALLSDASSEPFNAYTRLDLPPLDHNILKASGRPSPLEPNTSTRNDKRPSINVQQVVNLDREGSEGIAAKVIEENETLLHAPPKTDRALVGTSPQSLRKILDDVAATPQPSSSKRRQRIESTKDEFVQLPQPPKKQKATKQVVPPIIIGLFEPPPNAALFPPIASSSFHDSHGRNSLNTGPPSESPNHAPPDIQIKNITNSDVETKVRKDGSMRLRKKWTEVETTQLLLGVQAHGVGNWTKILQDPDFHFDGRRAVDLKDRFRTCCPTELRRESAQVFKSPHNGENACRIGVPKSKLELGLESSQTDSDTSSNDEKTLSAPGKGPHKSRAHRKKIEDLAELGIREPFKRSLRRERRPFSDAEDRDILQGFQDYGPAWTRILKDPRFDLITRRPTDLRDRLRNRYPEKYFIDVKESSSLANQTGSSLLPSQNLVSSLGASEVSTNLTSSTQLPAGGVLFRDNFLELLGPAVVTDPPDALSFDWNDNVATFPNNMGEMDISRILLDDTWNTRKFN